MKITFVKSSVTPKSQPQTTFVTVALVCSLWQICSRPIHPAIGAIYNSSAAYFCLIIFTIFEIKKVVILEKIRLKICAELCSIFVRKGELLYKYDRSFHPIN